MKIDTWENNFKKIDQIEGLLVPGQEKVLYDAAASLKKGSTIVEIGSFKGRSAACFGLGRRDKSIKIYAIDTFAGNNKDFVRGVQFKNKQFRTDFERNMQRLKLENVIPVPGYSSEVGKTWRKKIDLLFIDGSHIYEDVKADLELFFPWVKPGGWFCFMMSIQSFPGSIRSGTRWRKGSYLTSPVGTLYILGASRNLMRFLSFCRCITGWNTLKNA